MAFYDAPKIDDNSKKSEESVLAVKGFFTQKVGFISREDNPDYGVDLDIELIDKNSGATRRQFAIQIKATKNIKTIHKDGQDFISFQFKTSRLGYLVRRAPGYGIITLFDENNNITYFDFVEDIIRRIINNKETESWKTQDNVNIHIPQLNILSKTVARSIWERINQRFENHNLLLSTYGETFGIPIFIDKNDIKEITPIEILKKYGHDLINQREFKLILDFLNKANRAQLIKDPEIVLYSAVAYCETGNPIEASYFLARSKIYKERYNKGNQETLMLIQSKVELLLGEVSFEDYEIKMKEILINVSTNLNKINAQLSLFLLEVTKKIETSGFNSLFESQMINFFSKIDSINIREEHKQYLKVQHCETIWGYLHAFLARIISENRLLMSLQEKTDEQKLQEKLKRHQSLNQKCHDIIKMATTYAKTKQKEILIAYIFFQECKYFFGLQFKRLMLQSSPPFTTELKANYSQYIEKISTAIKIFNYNDLQREKYVSMNLILEIQRIFFLLYSHNLEIPNVKEIQKEILEIEKNSGIKPYNLVVENAYNKIHKRESQSKNDSWKDATDEFLIHFAKRYIESKKLPPERFSNVLLDMKNYRKFAQECKKPNIELRHDLTETSNFTLKYDTPAKYVIFNNKTNMVSLSSHDIDELLKLSEKF